MLSEGTIEDDPTLKFKWFDKNHVAYLSPTDKKIRLLNVIDGTKAGTLDHASLPTKAALSGEQYSEENADKLANL